VRAEQPVPRLVEVPPGTSRLQLLGRNLLAGGAIPAARLDGVPLETTAADDHHLEVALPAQTSGGALELDLGTGEPLRLDVRVSESGDHHGNDDRWAPGP